MAGVGRSGLERFMWMHSFLFYLLISPPLKHKVLSASGAIRHTLFTAVVVLLFYLCPDLCFLKDKPKQNKETKINAKFNKTPLLLLIRKILGV